MPSDFSSAARSLSLPLSPPHSPDITPSATPTRPSWHRGQSSMSHRTPSNDFYNHESTTQRLIRTADKLNKRAMRMMQKLSPIQRAALVSFGIFSFIITILFFVYNESILHWLRPKAEAWRDLKGGWAILWALTFITAFPPMIGYSTCITIAGFVYGFPLGWPIVATANVVGSFLSFLLFRYLLSSWAHRFTASDSRFAALALVLKNDGLKLLVMIRLCPLPYSLSNGALSTFQTISPLNFALATALATPKLLIHVFIGSRLGALAGPMDGTTKAVNWASIIFGSILGAGTGWWVYKRTQARARQLEAEEQAKTSAQGRRARGTVRGGVGEHGLQHPDAFVDDLGESEDEAGGENTRLRNGDEQDGDVDFEWGEDNEPYSDEVIGRRGDEETGLRAGNRNP